MATLKSSQKSKAEKNSSTKTAKKTPTSRVKKTIDAQPKPIESSLVPVTPEFEEKLTKAYYSLEKYLRGFPFGGSLISLYLLYMVFKSKGELLIVLNFLGVVAISIGIGYASRLFTKQSKKSIAAYGYTMIFIILFTGLVIWLSGSNRLMLGWIIGIFFVLAIFTQMLQLKKYNFLY